jgi:hypothetical protein
MKVFTAMRKKECLDLNEAMAIYMRWPQLVLFSTVIIVGSEYISFSYWPVELVLDFKI